MANWIKIATIGPAAQTMDANEGYQKTVDRMIEWWDSRFAQVLPSEPDLIVVPEACDRPSNFNIEQRKEYYQVRGNQVRDFFATMAQKYPPFSCSFFILCSYNFFLVSAQGPRRCYLNPNMGSAFK